MGGRLPRASVQQVLICPTVSATMLMLLCLFLLIYLSGPFVRFCCLADCGLADNATPTRRIHTKTRETSHICLQELMSHTSRHACVYVTALSLPLSICVCVGVYALSYTS